MTRERYNCSWNSAVASTNIGLPASSNILHKYKTDHIRLQIQILVNIHKVIFKPLYFFQNQIYLLAFHVTKLCIFIVNCHGLINRNFQFSQTNQMNFPCLNIKTLNLKQSNQHHPCSTFFLAFDFCRFCLIICSATTANDLRLRRISIPDFIHYIFCPIYFLREEPVFP